MINRAVIMGRITHPLEIRQTPAGVAVLQFTVAVDRNYTDQNGERQADFISCVAWRQTAEFIGRYFDKGRMIAVEGRLQSRTYEDKNGTKHYITELIVDQASFTGEPKQEGTQGGYYQQQNGGYNQQNNGGYNQQPQGFGNMNEFEDVLNDEGVPF